MSFQVLSSRIITVSSFRLSPASYKSSMAQDCILISSVTWSIQMFERTSMKLFLRICQLTKKSPPQIDFVHKIPRYTASIPMSFFCMQHSWSRSYVNGNCYLCLSMYLFWWLLLNVGIRTGLASD